LHEFEAFIYQALKGTAVVDYFKNLITQQMGAPGLPAPEGLARWVINFEKLNKKARSFQTGLFVVDIGIVEIRLFF